LIICVRNPHIRSAVFLPQDATVHSVCLKHISQADVSHLTSSATAHKGTKVTAWHHLWRLDL